MSRRPLGRRHAPVLLVPLLVLVGAWSLGLLPSEASRDAALVEAGREQFIRIRHTEVAADPKLAAHRMFNARSCAECHRQAGIGGGGPNENNVQLIDASSSLSFDPRVANVFGSAQGPVVLHRRSSAPEYAAWRLSVLRRHWRYNPEVVAAPKGETEYLPVRPIVATMPPPADDRLIFRSLFLSPPEERNTPPLYGLGLLESIAQCEIDAVALGQPERIRGRSPRLKEGGHGRFGWKAGRATLLAFNENACAVELGLTTPNFTPAAFRPSDVAPDYRPAALGMLGTLGATTWKTNGYGLWYVDLDYDDYPGVPITSSTKAVAAPAPEPMFLRAAGPPPAPDMSHADVVALTRFVASLPAPRQVIDPSKREQVAAGARHFEAVGCTACHTPNLGGVEGLYSDLLLHSVGTSAGAYYGGTPSDGAENFDIVRGDEIRTPPLWGVADSGPYLHDGSAPTLDAAILKHSVQGADAVTAYRSQLNDDQRQSLIAFLESLRAP
jgi:mono/diheme cytochrome c family protein